MSECIFTCFMMCCQVTEEMLAVLSEGEGREEGGGHCQETASSLSQLSIQTVFSMLSHLTQWSRYILYSKHKNGGESANQRKLISFHIQGCQC